MSLALDSLEENVDAVIQLARLDAQILDVALRRLRSVRDALRHDNIVLTHPLYGVETSIKALENIEGAASLGKRYKAMYNQCVVLLVSHFESSARQMFREQLAVRLQANPPQSILNEELTFKVSDLLELPLSAAEALAHRIGRGEHISFQDTQSIGRTFRKYLECEIEFDEITKTVAFAQACRHAIVHNGALADDRWIRQCKPLAAHRLSHVAPVLGESIEFGRPDVEAIGASMIEYLDRVERLCGAPSSEREPQ